MKNKDLVKVDEAAFRHDQLIISIKTTTESGDPQWDQHPAKKLLKKNTDEKKDKVITPRELWKSRKDTKTLPMVYNLYQEIYDQNQSAYWQYVKEPKR